MKLTKKAVDKLSSPSGFTSTGKEIPWKLYCDSELKGFAVRIYLSGAKTFCCYYRFNGIKKWITIGQYGAWTVDRARDRARKIRVLAQEGKDPLEELKNSRKRGPTFYELVERYRETYILEISSVTRQRYNYFIDTLLLPKLKYKEVTAITRRMIEDIVFNFKKSKNKNTGGRISGATTNRFLALCSKLFSLAIKFGWTKDNPVKGIERFKEVCRERIATEQETERIVAAIQQEENIFYRHFFLVIWLTMARRGEIQKMKWKNLDLENGYYHMNESKAGRPFTIPLNQQAVEIINNTPKIVGNPYVFAGSALGRSINGFSKAWKRIRDRAGVPDIWIHDVRRTGGSNMIMDGASLQDVAQLLNHSNLSTTQRYAQLAQAHKKKKMDEHGERLKKITGNIINFEKAKKELRNG